MGIAAATSVEAATVQITLNQSYTVTFASGFIDLTGDGVVDGMRFDAGAFEGNPMYFSPGGTFVALRNPNPTTYGGFDYAAVIRWYDGNFEDTFRSFSPNTTGASFSDSRINGGALTFGLLETTVGMDSLTAVRLVFNNASTVAPTGPLAASYDAFVPGAGGGTSAVPEDSTSLGLLALGAGGLLTRRRTSRKA